MLVVTTSPDTGNTPLRWYVRTAAHLDAHYRALTSGCPCGVSFTWTYPSSPKSAPTARALRIAAGHSRFISGHLRNVIDQTVA